MKLLRTPSTTLETPRPRPRSGGFQLTRVGLGFVLLAAIVLLAATNTGNNGLYLVLAVMGGVLVVSHALASRNVRGLAVELRPAGECFANSPASLEVSVAREGGWLDRRSLVVGLHPEDVEPQEGWRRQRTSAFYLPRLGPGEPCEGTLELLVPRRGWRRLCAVRVASLFPFGLFRKRVRYPVDTELLVYPEIFSPSETQPERLGRSGSEPMRRPGWGHDLLGLRPFRHGDDPRGIHWKQTARTGELIFKEREKEESRRLSILFDNAAGELASPEARERFERLVSEAATAAVDYLERGYEVELVTRDRRVPFGAGPRQRRTVLERLALIEPLPERAGPPLELGRPAGRHLRLAMEPPERGAA